MAKYTLGVEDFVSLAASTYSPSCVGAALMASDIYYAAYNRSREMPKRYRVVAHGTDTAGDRRYVYQCTISNKYRGVGEVEYRIVTALCLNFRGDGFKYVFRWS